MRVITLVLVIVAIFFFAKDAQGRTIILDEEQVETVEGKTFYVLTMCNVNNSNKEMYGNRK